MHHAIFLNFVFTYILIKRDVVRAKLFLICQIRGFMCNYPSSNHNFCNIKKQSRLNDPFGIGPIRNPDMSGFQIPLYLDHYCTITNTSHKFNVSIDISIAVFVPNADVLM